MFITKKSFLYLTLLAIVALSFGACKKDDDDKSNREQLVDKNWKLAALTANPAINFGGTLHPDIYAQLQACDKDDLTIFKTDGVINFDDSAIRCSSVAPQIVLGVWTLNADETVIAVDGVNWTIVDLTDSQLKVTYAADPTGSGVNSTITATYKKS